ncbi:uncharacterized protein (TIGR02118 family) [Amycolatopsis endophytica]|uniref:Uncharacterized protein (TIGR02118 family) n=1 Tax=Amycolatopsis endophytica TaxID=860233 RepID=A0A853B0J0_9PSEU|nr:EthD domain-containing protein [Amycolatopsis endophytica]NYI88377.1 uncharacterized protein (TIGR02118 family) [Amycolatopsis endophytica]
MVITLKRRQGMTHEEFKHYQQTIHRPLLMSIPESDRYLRRFVVSYPVPAPRYPEPDYDSVVEAWFDTMADLESLYFSDNFRQIVDPDHANFIDLSAFGRIICEEVVGAG